MDMAWYAVCSVFNAFEQTSQRTNGTSNGVKEDAMRWNGVEMR